MRRRLISIRAPREGSDFVSWTVRGQVDISIRAPREGSDVINDTNGEFYILFLSALPARGATVFPLAASNFRAISIRAPREGSDALRSRGWPRK